MPLCNVHSQDTNCSNVMGAYTSTRYLRHFWTRSLDTLNTDTPRTFNLWAMLSHYHHYYYLPIFDRNNNPYHNNMHACDVLQTAHWYVAKSGISVSVFLALPCLLLYLRIQKKTSEIIGVNEIYFLKKFNGFVIFRINFFIRLNNLINSLQI